MMRQVPIGELVDSASSWNPKSEGVGQFNYIDLSSVDKSEKRINGVEQLNCNQAPSRARQLVKKGDILVATVRPNLNGVAMVFDEHHGMTASTGYTVLRPISELLDGKYLFHWVKTPQFVSKMVDVASGANYPAVSDKKVKESTIPLPPFAEQKRVAKILDAADMLRVKRRESLAQLDALLQSTFLEMFGDPVENPKGWEKRPLAEITKKIGSGATPRGGRDAYKEEGISLIRSLNVHDGSFRWKDLAFIDDQQAAKLDNVVVESKDVLLNITGASVARCCLAPSSAIPARVNQHVAIIRPDRDMSPRFLATMLTSPPMKNHLLKIAESGATRQAITKKQIQELKVLIPPRDLQAKFDSFAEGLDSQNRLRSDSIAEFDGLFEALQSHAFAGSL